MAGVSVVCNDRRKGGSVEDGGRPALWLQDLDSDSTQLDVINEILVHDMLADWNMRDIARLSKQQGETIVNNKADLDPVDLVLNIFEQLDLCKQGPSSVDSEKGEAKTMIEVEKRTNIEIKIITIDDSSDDKDAISKTPVSSAHATVTTCEITRGCREDIFYGPPPPVASHAVALSYSEYGWAMVVQVDSVHKQ